MAGVLIILLFFLTYFVRITKYVCCCYVYFNIILKELILICQLLNCCLSVLSFFFLKRLVRVRENLNALRPQTNSNSNNNKAIISILNTDLSVLELV